MHSSVSALQTSVWQPSPVLGEAAAGAPLPKVPLPPMAMSLPGPVMELPPMLSP